MKIIFHTLICLTAVLFFLHDAMAADSTDVVPLLSPVPQVMRCYGNSTLGPTYNGPAHSCEHNNRMDCNPGDVAIAYNSWYWTSGAPGFETTHFWCYMTCAKVIAPLSNCKWENA